LEAASGGDLLVPYPEEVCIFPEKTPEVPDARTALRPEVR
jgi:hypothetical protein